MPRGCVPTAAAPTHAPLAPTTLATTACLERARANQRVRRSRCSNASRSIASHLLRAVCRAVATPASRHCSMRRGAHPRRRAQQRRIGHYRWLLLTTDDSLACARGTACVTHRARHRRAAVAPDRRAHGARATADQRSPLGHSRGWLPRVNHETDVVAWRRRVLVGSIRGAAAGGARRHVVPAVAVVSMVVVVVAQQGWLVMAPCTATGDRGQGSVLECALTVREPQQAAINLKPHVTVGQLERSYSATSTEQRRHRTTATASWLRVPARKSTRSTSARLAYTSHAQLARAHDSYLMQPPLRAGTHSL